MVEPDLLATMKSVFSRLQQALDRPQRFRIGGVEHEKPPAAGPRGKQQRENLRRQAGPAHAQEHDVAQARHGYVVREIGQVGRFRTHLIHDRQPAEAIGNGAGVRSIVLPQAGLAVPQTRHHLLSAQAAQFSFVGRSQASGNDPLFAQWVSLPREAVFPRRLRFTHNQGGTASFLVAPRRAARCTIALCLGILVAMQYVG